MNYFLTCLKKYAVFRGRASRKEYWYFYLVFIVIFILLSIIEAVLEMAGILSSLFLLAILLPSYAVTVRRYHDSGHSGWWIFVPVVSAILLFYRSQPGDNKYGPHPVQTKQQ